MVEPLANAVHALRLVPDVRGARVGVIGAGAIGLLCLLVARRFGAGRRHGGRPVARAGSASPTGWARTRPVRLWTRSTTWWSTPSGCRPLGPTRCSGVRPGGTPSGSVWPAPKRPSTATSWCAASARSLGSFAYRPDEFAEAVALSADCDLGWTTGVALEDSQRVFMALADGTLRHRASRDPSVKGLAGQGCPGHRRQPRHRARDCAPLSRGGRSSAPVRARGRRRPTTARQRARRPRRSAAPSATSARSRTSRGLVSEASASLGGIDVLANNAGIALARAVPRHHDRALGPDHRGQPARHVPRRAGRRTAHGRAGGGGAIVNMASTNGLGAEADYAHYNASKGARGPAHPHDGRRARAARHSGQRAVPRLHRHAAQPRDRGRDRPTRLRRRLRARRDPARSRRRAPTRSPPPTRSWPPTTPRSSRARRS